MHYRLSSLVGVMYLFLRNIWDIGYISAYAVVVSISVNNMYNDNYLVICLSR